MYLCRWKIHWNCLILTESHFPTIWTFNKKVLPEIPYSSFFLKLFPELCIYMFFPKHWAGSPVFPWSPHWWNNGIHFTTLTSEAASSDSWYIGASYKPLMNHKHSMSWASTFFGISLCVWLHSWSIIHKHITDGPQQGYFFQVMHCYIKI